MIKHFDILAPFYDRILKYNDHKFLLNLLALPVEGWLLDAGGGTGRVAITLTNKAPQVVVSDLSLKMLQQATRKGLRTVCSYAETLPFAAATFERVVMVDAFHHLCQQEQTAGELWRVLRPGGRIVILEPDIKRPLVKVIALFEKVSGMRSHFLPLQKILQAFPFPGSVKSAYRDRHNLGIVIEKVKNTG